MFVSTVSNSPNPIHHRRQHLCFHLHRQLFPSLYLRTRLVNWLTALVKFSDLPSRGTLRGNTGLCAKTGIILPAHSFNRRGRAGEESESAAHAELFFEM
jgi:hypothetical protein